MSYQSVAAALPGLVAGWMLDDASGTSLADFGPNTLPLTLGPRGALGGASILPESARSLSSSGALGAVAASRAVGAGSPLQLSTGVTFCGWVTMGAPISTGWVGGRASNWQIRQAGAAGTYQGVVYVGGAGKTVTGRTTFAAGTTAFVAVTFDGHDILFVVNGAIEGRLTVPGSINATTDEIDVLSGSATNPYQGTGQGFLVYNRALSLGELRKLLRAGDTAHTIENTASGPFFDLVADASPVVAASAQTRYCSLCGGLMRANERGALAPDYHPDCHVLAQRTPIVPTSGSTYSDFATQAMHLIHEFTSGVGKRAGASRTIYSDGTQWLGSANLWVQAGGVGTAAAILHRYLRAGKRSPWLSVVRMTAANVIAQQAATGSFGAVTDGNGFAQQELGMMVLLTKNAIEPATWNSWRDAFLRGCYFELNGTPARTTTVPATTSGLSDATYYINGNRNLQVALVFYIAYLVTGDTYWQTQYETQLTFTLNPPTNGFGSALGGSSNGAGLFNFNTGTLIPQASLLGLSDTTDMAYLTESAGTNAWGIDWDYLQLQLDFAHRLWLLSGDARILKLTNLFRNCANQRLTRSTWSYNATGGTRHSLATAWLTTAEHSLVYKAGRGDITVADLASMWTLASGGLEANYRTQGMTGNVSYYRGIGVQVGSVLMAQSDWPGVPA